RATRRRVKQRAQHPKRSCGARPLNTVRCNSAQHVETPERTEHREMTRSSSSYSRVHVVGTLHELPSQRKRMFSVARPKIFRPSDFAATMTTPERVAGSSDLIRPLNSMSAPSVADTIAGWDSRTA